MYLDCRLSIDAATRSSGVPIREDTVSWKNLVLLLVIQRYLDIVPPLPPLSQSFVDCSVADPFESVKFFRIRDPFLGVLGSESVSYSNGHSNINWEGKLNKKCLLVGYWQAY
jgi:hypothetical protein